MKPNGWREMCAELEGDCVARRMLDENYGLSCRRARILVYLRKRKGRGA